MKHPWRAKINHQTIRDLPRCVHHPRPQNRCGFSIIGEGTPEHLTVFVFFVLANWDFGFKTYSDLLSNWNHVDFFKVKTLEQAEESLHQFPAMFFCVLVSRPFESRKKGNFRPNICCEPELN